jgi:hypothetical protein
MLARFLKLLFVFRRYCDAVRASRPLLNNASCRITDAVAIADADLTIKKFINSEGFSELAESKITPPQNPLPVVIRVHLVDEHGAVPPAMTRDIRAER